MPQLSFLLSITVTMHTDRQKTLELIQSEFNTNHATLAKNCPQLLLMWQ